MKSFSNHHKHILQPSLKHINIMLTTSQNHLKIILNSSDNKWLRRLNAKSNRQTETTSVVSCSRSTNKHGGGFARQRNWIALLRKGRPLPSPRGRWEGKSKSLAWPPNRERQSACVAGQVFPADTTLD